MKYTHCDDWLIFATDGARYYYVVTELWEEWFDLPEGADQEEGAVETYMLPIALKRRDSLCGEPVDGPDWSASFCILCSADAEENEEHHPSCELEKEALYRMARERIQGLGLDPDKWVARID
jgi:hypothetical protein